MSNTAKQIPSGRVSVWPSISVEYFKKYLIAEALGKPTPPLPSYEEIQNSNLIPWKEVAIITGAKRGHIEFLIKRGVFPPAIKLPAAILKHREAA